MTRRVSAIVLAISLAVLVLLASGAFRRAEAEATRTGAWAYADASYGPRYLAIPEGRGFDVRVCGPLGCLERVSTDAGPALWLQRTGRIGDVSSADFVVICGPLGPGLCRGGSYTILGVADQSGDDPPEHPDDDRLRIEDGGPGPTLPPTDSE